ncbi:MAG: SAM-dependent methyltransferase [Bacteroidales bacterium]
MTNPHHTTPRLFLIPSDLGGESAGAVWPAGNLERIGHLRTFIVENIRSARRFLRMAGFIVPFEEVTFLVLNKHTRPTDIPGYLDAASMHADIGLLSEAGSPCVADPGQAIVRLAHTKGIRVVPLVGASSILLGLMASGFNGQQFAFHGYLPIPKNLRQKKIRDIEQTAYQHDQTQIFMEAPFRNNQLTADLILCCRDETLLCIASDLSLPSEFIATKPIREWKKKMPDLHKRASIFLIYHD